MWWKWKEREREGRPFPISIVTFFISLCLYFFLLFCCADVNFEELARTTEDFNGAMLKAVCVEAGMIALRREASIIKHEDFVEGCQAVQMKKKQEQNYYT